MIVVPRRRKHGFPIIDRHLWRFVNLLIRFRWDEETPVDPDRRSGNPWKIEGDQITAVVRKTTVIYGDQRPLSEIYFLNVTAVIR